MAGLGSRFFNAGFTSPKPLIELFDSTIVEHSIRSLNIEGDYIFITRKFKNHDHNRKLEQILRKVKPSALTFHSKFCSGLLHSRCKPRTRHATQRSPLRHS